MELGLEKYQASLAKVTRLPRTQRIAILTLLTVAVAGLYVYLFYLPARETLDRLGAQQLELQRKLSEVRSVAANLPAFQARLTELESELRTALRQLPNSKELPGLLTDISSRGKNAGLEFKAFRPKDEVAREFYAEVPIEIEFTGGFHDVARFFDDVSKLPRIVNVADLKIEIEKETPLGTRLLVKGNATTFRFLEQGGTPAAAPTPVRPAPARAGGGDA
ncbi:MAG: type 4a pilus biogenesis protein PilO [Deltaproteobacteria bacterium]|nr:type 4a pilus biogenesis protein PilO [Deltaproteobacteria bacterium]